MKENEFPVLKIEKIDWDKDHDDIEKLPKEVEVRWNTKEWKMDEVSDWLGVKFDWIFDSLSIKRVGVHGSTAVAVALVVAATAMPLSIIFYWVFHFTIFNSSCPYYPVSTA